MPSPGHPTQDASDPDNLKDDTSPCPLGHCPPLHTPHVRPPHPDRGCHPAERPLGGAKRGGCEPPCSSTGPMGGFP